MLVQITEIGSRSSWLEDKDWLVGQVFEIKYKSQYIQFESGANSLMDAKIVTHEDSGIEFDGDWCIFDCKVKFLKL